VDAKPLCAKHRSEVKIWRGQGCGEAGWGPGHRLPAGITVTDVDRQVTMIKGFCRDARNCGDTAHEWKCDSRDRCERRDDEDYDKCSVCGGSQGNCYACTLPVS
jgi:hypothetical protein